ncbi:CMGC SRPK kinase [Fusarium beomiforme]|uniref:non-specific serine/threonine protein kinase n=1 Tax=Fusarium beomiforme TaxID=44412 RepID=A0A9P5AJ77_9HYPO|nr:CMGC SRPK kinase [Fusarium beomiforme]
MLGPFTVDGPNGTHDCLVLELAGPNIAEIADIHCKHHRLPSDAARSISKQVLQGLDFLHFKGIGHGDIHTGNIALAIPDLQSLSGRDFIARLGEPEMGLVTRPGGKPLTSNMPTHIVRPASFRDQDVQVLLLRPCIEIIDFGEAFFSHDSPSTLNTPLPIFELITGQPPFDVLMLTTPILIEQMIEFLDDELPERWLRKWQEMKRAGPQQDDVWKLQGWMEEVYFDHNKHPEFTRDEIRSIAQLIARLPLSPAVVMLTRSTDLTSVLAVLLELDGPVRAAREEGIVDLVLLETSRFGGASELVGDFLVVFSYGGNPSEVFLYKRARSGLADV